MRILHSSDWHLGQYFMGMSRQREHQKMMDWLLNIIQDKAIDLLLVCGDIFDTGQPPSYARLMLNDLIIRLHALGVSSVFLAGNHDSPAVFRENKSLLALLNSFMIESINERIEDNLIVFKNANQEPELLLCALPFIRARDAYKYGDLLLNNEQKEQQWQHLILQRYQNLSAGARAKQAAILAKTGRYVPIVMTGHLTMFGVQESESVRATYVGGIEALALSAFPEADYFALGHIHKAMSLSNTRQVRYSGSPIPLAFDEAEEQKVMLIIDFDAAGQATIEKLQVPVFQKLFKLKTSFDRLEFDLKNLATQAKNGERIWVDLCLESQDFLGDIRSKIDNICTALPLDILKITRLQSDVLPAWHDQEKVITLDELSPNDVFLEKLKEYDLKDEEKQRLNILFLKVLRQLHETKEP